MDCTEARTHLLDRRRGILDEGRRRALEAHLDECAACRHEDTADAELTHALARHLPAAGAPASLRRSLERRWVGPTKRAERRAERGPWVWGVGGMACGAALAMLVVFAWRARAPGDAMLAEAVNDHLRVLYSEHPVEVEGPDTHKVKPWFAGRLDFAPVMAFGGDDEFPLRGGSVSYFLDRKAATLVFGRRLHVITLFIFRSEGMRWPAVEETPIGHVHGTLLTSRGFHVVLWNAGDLGYALVSDVDSHDLTALGAKIAGP
jgi:anti-sigma factor RsiW